MILGKKVQNYEAFKFIVKCFLFILFARQLVNIFSLILFLFLWISLLWRTERGQRELINVQELNLLSSSCVCVCVRCTLVEAQGVSLPSRGLSGCALGSLPLSPRTPGSDGGLATQDDLFRTLHDIFWATTFFSFVLALRSVLLRHLVLV